MDKPVSTALRNLTFVTQSKGKLVEAERILGTKLNHHSLDLPEPQAIDVDEVIAFKAEYAYNILHAPVLIEDTGLYIHTWNGLPGALVKWFINSVGDQGICQMLSQFHDRRATAKTIVATFDGKLNIFVGLIEGCIAPNPSGNNGFGWDTIFIPDNSTKTFAEMTENEKDHFSMRRLAFEAMLKHYLD